jgi:hypothetical protein
MDSFSIFFVFFVVMAQGYSSGFLCKRLDLLPLAAKEMRDIKEFIDLWTCYSAA